MISTFLSIFKSPRNSPPVVLNLAERQIADIPRYPPFDRGLPAVPPEALLHSQQEIIDRIERTAGLTPEEFKSRMMPVIQNLAKYVHLVPATSTGHHRGAGGLFRMALEIALYSLQIGNSTIFANKGTVSTEARYLLHPKWVYATFIAGLCSEIYRPICHMVIVDDTGDKWPQLLMPLYDWISQKEKDRYFIVWNIQDEIDLISLSQVSSAYLLNAVVPMSSLQYLNEGNSEIVATMTACVTGSTQTGANGQIRQIVTSVRNKVIERDIKSNSERYGLHSVGSHLEPHLIDAMRRLIRKKTWEVNVKGSRIWYSNEGLFVVWQPAAREIISLLTEDNQAGFPQDGDTLAEIMVTSGIAERNDDDGLYWDICIPATMQILPAIKLSRVEILFPDTTLLEPVNDRLISSVAEEDVAEKPIKPPKAKTPTAQPPTHKTTVEKPDAPLDENKGVNHQKLPEGKEQDPGVSELPLQASIPTNPDSQVTAQSVEPCVAAQEVKQSRSLKDKTTKGKTKKEDLGLLADKLFSSLPKDVSDHLKAIVEDYQDGSSTGFVFSVEGGMAISTDELEAHGQANFAGLLKVLYDKGWLWTDPEKIMRKMFDVEHKGKKVRVIILRGEVARGLGFDWKKPKKGTE